MTSVTVQLTGQEIKALKGRTGKKNAEAPLKAWAASANAERTSGDLREALKEALQEGRCRKGRRFRIGREAIRWPES